MDSKGLTLTEIVITMIIIVISCSFSIPAVGTWKKKHRLEQAVNEMYSYLNESRATALSRHQVCGLTWQDDNVQLIRLQCDTDNDGEINDNNGKGFTTIWGKCLPMPFSLKGKSFENGTCRFSFYGTALQSGTFIFDTNETSSEYTCVTVSRFRLRMGKWNGNECVSQ